MVPVVILQLAPILYIAEASVAVVAAQVLAQTIQKASYEGNLPLAAMAIHEKIEQENPFRCSKIVDKELLIVFLSFLGLLYSKGGQPFNSCLPQFLLHICGSKKQSSICPTTLLLGGPQCWRTIRTHTIATSWQHTLFQHASTSLKATNTSQRNHTYSSPWLIR